MTHPYYRIPKAADTGWQTRARVCYSMKGG